MSVFKCKMCGGDLVIEQGSTVAECEYCGSKQTVPTADSEKKLTLFGRAGRLLRSCEFDKAAGIFETIIADFPEEAEAYWGLVLCRFGIEYVDDPKTGKKIPTCHRSGFESVMDDKDFEQACENADPLARKLYREEAKKFEELRKSIIEVSGREEPYDIFICYKETAEDGQRTIDSVLAQDIYEKLTDAGYRVFFSRITLEDKLGQEYEPYIFAALNSAKVMLVFGSDYEYFNAVWVKNEWSRYLKLMEKDKEKRLIPCYKDIDAYDMPKEFAKLQAQDMGKVGADQDLVRAIKKLLPRETEHKADRQQIVVQQGGTNIDSTLRRAFIYLEDSNWQSARQYAEKVLDSEPENAEAYLVELMAEFKIGKRSELSDCEKPFDASGNYAKAMRFGDEKLKKELDDSLDKIKERTEFQRRLGIFEDAAALMDSACKSDNLVERLALYREAETQFRSVASFKNADELAEKCVEHEKAIQKKIDHLKQDYESAYESEFKKIKEIKEKLEQAEQKSKEAKAAYKHLHWFDIIGIVGVIVFISILLIGSDALDTTFGTICFFTSFIMVFILIGCRIPLSSRASSSEAEYKSLCRTLDACFGIPSFEEYVEQKSEAFHNKNL